MSDKSASAIAYLHITAGPPLDYIRLQGIALTDDKIEVSSESTLVIGRNPQVVDLQVYNISDNCSISRVHCSIKFDKHYGKFMLTDEASTNGTFIGEERLKSHESIQLKDGDIVTLGSTTFHGIQFMFSTQEIASQQAQQRLILRPFEPARSTGRLDMDAIIEDAGDEELLKMIGAVPKSKDELAKDKSSAKQVQFITNIINKYDIFISYSHADVETMKSVSDFLTDEYNFNIWTDHELEPGTESWQFAIEKVIENTHCVIALMSPSAKQSEWVRRELMYAQSWKVNLFPVLVDGDENTAVPLVLAGSQYVDLRKDKLQSNLQNLAHIIEVKIAQLKNKTSD